MAAGRAPWHALGPADVWRPGGPEAWDFAVTSSLRHQGLQMANEQPTAIVQQYEAFKNSY